MMSTAADLLSRLKMQYIEMPALSLTARQAARLLQFDPDVIQFLLSRLVTERFLVKSSDGQFFRPGVARHAGQ
jgi:hypothetical protein